MTGCSTILEVHAPVKVSYEIDREAFVIVNEGIRIKGKAAEEVK
jgi:hypothetical protein